MFHRIKICQSAEAEINTLSEINRSMKALMDVPRDFRVQQALDENSPLELSGPRQSKRSQETRIMFRGYFTEYSVLNSNTLGQMEEMR
jgi:hypothetical protein